MAVLELYGKCKELGYCDCGGFLGCSDPDHVGGRLSPAELASARKAVKAEAIGEGHRKYDANEPLLAMVECEICDRSHAPSHPHITNIDGDVPIDDVDLDDAPDTQAATPARELPDWLKDKPGSQMIRPANKPSEVVPPTCGVCGEPWASKHVCKGAEAPEFNRQVSAPSTRQQYLCEVCSKVKRSNHNCKGALAAEKPCHYCGRAGEPCVRHGGERSSVRASKRYQARKEAAQSPIYVQADGNVAVKLPEPVSVAQTQTDERVATELPQPVVVTRPATGAVTAPEPELDRELSAIVTILIALDGPTADEVKRALAYVADRKGIKQEHNHDPLS